MASKNEKIAALKAKVKQVTNLLNRLYDEFQKPRYNVSTTRKVVGLAEKAGVINQQEQKVLDNMNARLFWINTELAKLEGLKADYSDHDSKEYVDLLKDKTIQKAFNTALSIRINAARNTIARLSRHLNRNEKEEGLDLKTGIDIIQKIIVDNNPAIKDKVETARFIAEVVIKAFKTLSKTKKFNPYVYLTNLDKSLEKLSAELTGNNTRIFFSFGTSFLKSNNIPAKNANSHVKRKDFIAYQEAFMKNYLKPGPLINGIIKHLMKNLSADKKEGTVSVNFSYDKTKKKFTFKSGEVVGLPGDLKKILVNDKGDESVLSLPFKIKVNISTSILSRYTTAVRHSNKPNDNGFVLDFPGDENMNDAKAIVANFVKANPLNSVPCKNILK